MGAQEQQVLDWAGLGKTKISQIAPDSTWVSVPLLPEEGKRYFQNKGITSCTFFAGDAEVATARLRERVALMLEANPWLAGSLRSKKLMTHPPSGAGMVDQIFSVIENQNIKQTGIDFNSLTEACWRLGVDRGSELVRTGYPVTRVIIVTGGVPAAEGFALIFSISHVVADGWTYYQLINMLSSSGEVRTLSPVRPPPAEYKAKESKAIGLKEYAWGMGIVFIKAMIAGLMKKTPIKGNLSCYYIDPDKLVEAKQSAASASPTGYVSSNDVIASHFFSAVGAKIGMQTFNLRGRSEGFGFDRAGNYETIIPYDKGGSATPSSIRKSLIPDETGAHIGHTKPLPGFCSGASPCAFLTSWAFPFDLTIDGCEQQLHLPITPMPGGFANTPMDFAITFWAKPKQLAVFYVAMHCGREKLTGPKSILGSTVSTELFPG